MLTATTLTHSPPGPCKTGKTGKTVQNGAKRCKMQNGAKWVQNGCKLFEWSKAKMGKWHMGKLANGKWQMGTLQHHGHHFL